MQLPHQASTCNTHFCAWKPWGGKVLCLQQHVWQSILTALAQCCCACIMWGLLEALQQLSYRHTWDSNAEFMSHADFMSMCFTLGSAAIHLCLHTGNNFYA